MRSPYVIIVVAGIVSLGLVASVYLYSQQKLRLEQYKDKTRQAEEQEKNDKYEECKRDVYEDYQLRWGASCIKVGTDKKEEDCSLPADLAKAYEETLNRELDRCVKLYKSN